MNETKPISLEEFLVTVLGCTSLEQTHEAQTLRALVREREALENIVGAFRQMLCADTQSAFAESADLGAKHLAILDNLRQLAAAPIPRLIPADNCIKVFFNCNRCAEELPPGESLSEWARLNCGWTPMGFQVWCVRHECNVSHMDFEGHKFNANLNAQPPKQK